jgi:hypothetical protein
MSFVDWSFTFIVGETALSKVGSVGRVTFCVTGVVYEIAHRLLSEMVCVMLPGGISSVICSFYLCLKHLGESPKW